MAAVLVASVAIVPAATASPASADIGPCDTNSVFLGPYWWGAADATIKAPWKRMVLTADDWYGGHIWEEGNANQMWMLDCVGYDYDTQSRVFKFRLSDHQDRCLGVHDYYAGTTLDYCQEGVYNGQGWELWPVAQPYIPFEGYDVYGFAFYNPTYGQCLDVFNADWWNGTQVIIWDCHFNNNQVWY